MSIQMTVASSPEADASGDIAQVIASLPVSLHRGNGTADLVAVDGGSAGWAHEAEQHIEQGARGIMVICPVPDGIAALNEKASRRGVPVVIDGTWTYNPAVERARETFSELNDADTLLEARVNVPAGANLEQTLLAQLALIRCATDQVVNVTYARKNRHGYDALAVMASGGRAALTAICTDALLPTAVLRIVKPRTAVQMTLPWPATAAPGHVVVSGPEGATLLSTLWETSHRAAWRQLHRLVGAGEKSSDLDGFASDLAAIRTAL